MTLKPLLLLPLALAAASASAHAAGSHAESVTQEYDQVRRIALRDAKVQSAIAAANERLNAKILQLDPSLDGYVRQHPRGLEIAEPRIEAPASAPFRAPAPTVERAPKPKTPSSAAAPAPAPAPAGKTHVVAKGDTLGSIASRYGVSVSALQQANHISDARKLSVGQVLRIPGGGTPKHSAKPASKTASAPHAHTASAKPAAAHPAAGHAETKSWWNVF